MTINLLSGGAIFSTICAGLIWLLLFLLFLYVAGYCWRTGTLRAERDERERALKTKDGDA